MAGCPTGWSRVSYCSDEIACSYSTACSSRYQKWTHKYVRCQSDTGYTDCFWMYSDYSGCC